MKTPFDTIRPAMIEARAALVIGLGNIYRDRNKGYTPQMARDIVRQKIAAYRILSNIYSAGNVEFFNHDKRNVARLKKALAK